MHAWREGTIMFGSLCKSFLNLMANFMHHHVWFSCKNQRFHPEWGVGGGEGIELAWRGEIYFVIL